MVKNTYKNFGYKNVLKEDYGKIKYFHCIPQKIHLLKDVLKNRFKQKLLSFAHKVKKMFLKHGVINFIRALKDNFYITCDVK